ncbi:MAG: hypothetical protein V1763_03055 [Parcubacteria group bacterium]
MNIVTRVLVVAPNKTITPLVLAVNTISGTAECCWHFETKADVATKFLQAHTNNGSGPYDLVIIDDCLDCAKSLVLVATRNRWGEKFLILTGQPPKDSPPYYFLQRPITQKVLVEKISELITIIG